MSHLSPWRGYLIDSSFSSFSIPRGGVTTPTIYHLRCSNLPKKYRMYNPLQIFFLFFLISSCSFSTDKISRAKGQNHTTWPLPGTKACTPSGQAASQTFRHSVPSHGTTQMHTSRMFHTKWKETWTRMWAWERDDANPIGWCDEGRWLSMLITFGREPYKTLT
jgi:hypothetical protein